MTLIAALAAAFLAMAAPDASAQTQQQCEALAYAGNYDAGLRCMDMVRRQQGQQMQAIQWQMVHDAMRDPQCWAAYHGTGMDRRMPYEQFAYEWLATAHFTPDGIARFRQGEAENRQREMAALQDLRQAEQQRGEAQIGYWETYFKNQGYAGYGLRGQGPYINPNTGSVMGLNNTRPGTVTTDQDGTQYVMDDDGTYYARRPGGTWFPMQQAR